MCLPEIVGCGSLDSYDVQSVQTVALWLWILQSDVLKLLHIAQFKAHL